MTLEIDVLTLFPAMFDGPLAASIPAGSRSRASPAIRIHDLREWGLGRHRVGRRRPVRRGSGDDPAARAGRGRARRRSAAPDSTVILLDPVGEVFRQARAADLATRSHLVFVCPRYEGVDERIRVAGRPRAVDRRLRPDRRRAAGARRHRRRHPPAPGRHRGVVDGRGIVRRRPARIPAVHAAGRRSAARACRRS